jgi:hypothetical protein
MVIRRPAGPFILLFPAVYAALGSRSVVSFHRNFLSLYPFAALLCGAGALSVMWILRKLGRRRPRISAVVGPLVLLALVWLAASGLADAWMAGWGIWNQEESRTTAMKRLAELGSDLPRRQRRILVCSELRIHRTDLARLRRAGFRTRQAQLTAIVEPALRSRYNWIVLPSSVGAYTAGWKPRVRNDVDSARQRLLSVQRQLGPPRISIKGKETRLDSYSLNPGISVYATADAPAGDGLPGPTGGP